MNLPRIKELCPVLPEGWRWSKHGTLVFGDHEVLYGGRHANPLHDLCWACVREMWDDIDNVVGYRNGNRLIVVRGPRLGTLDWDGAPTPEEATLRAYTAWRKEQGNRHDH